MRRIWTILVTTMMVLVPYLTWAEPPEATLNFFLGKDVAVRAEVDTVWHVAVLHQSLEKGDWLQTGRACRAEILLTDGSVFRVGEETEYQLTDLTGKQGDTKLVKGKIWANIKKLGQRQDQLNIHAPTAVAAIRALPPAEQGKDRGVIYQVVVDENQSTQVMVYQGQVGVAPPSRPSRGETQPTRGPPQQVDLATWNRLVDEILLRERQRMLVKADGSIERGVLPAKMEVEDDWVQWNRERDRVLGLAPGGAAEQGVRSTE